METKPCVEFVEARLLKRQSIFDDVEILKRRLADPPDTPLIAEIIVERAKRSVYSFETWR